MISVLLVEDDRDLCAEISAFLSGAGFSVCVAGTIREADARLARPYDLLVLDINLPDGDGLSFCRQARRYIRSGIVMCTGRGERELRIASLRDGADAYLVKPVDPEELEATLLSVHRRLQGNLAPLASGMLPQPWYLDGERRLLTAPNGGTFLLNVGETRFLAALFADPERHARKDDLVALLAGDEPDYSAHRLEAMVSRLRSKAQSRCGLRLPVVSDYGRGYTFTEYARLL